VGDLNNDANLDLIWRNTSTGDDRVWYLDGGVNLIQSVPVLPANTDQAWKIVGLK